MDTATAIALETLSARIARGAMLATVVATVAFIVATVALIASTGEPTTLVVSSIVVSGVATLVAIVLAVVTGAVDRI